MGPIEDDQSLLLNSRDVVPSRVESLPVLGSLRVASALCERATYGRLTGRAGVCMSTLGPGATNLITGVADANMDRAPVVTFNVASPAWFYAKGSRSIR